MWNAKLRNLPPSSLLSKIGFGALISEMISQLNPLFFQQTLTVRCLQAPSSTQNLNVSLTESNHSPHPRISISTRSEAQASLFDYLHCTRGFDYVDAEHISKNSPNFVQGLVSKIENEKEKAQALSKFFRYNPINEFEPFLESLGLSPNEVISLLPRRLMFLDDDQLMLDNFRILCDYGIPRSKIGKMYKEANDIFHCKFGILVSKIMAYEQLGLSKSTVIKLVSCCPTLLVGDVNKGFVAVLKNLKKLGFENDWIGGYLSDKCTYNWNRILDRMRFLVILGYSETQMRVLFKTNPTLLFEGSGRNLYVLAGSLLKSGIKIGEIYSLLLRDPQVLSTRCVKNLLQAICFLFEIGMETKDVANVLSNNIKLLSMHSLKRPRSVLRILKVDESALCQILKEDPLKLLSFSNSCIDQPSLRIHDNILDKTMFLLKLGFVENSDEMTKALKQFRGRGNQLEERFNCLVQMGLDPNDVMCMVNRAPSLLNQSKEVLERKIGCLINYLNYPVDSLVAFPSYLCYDMNRINIRVSMYSWLRERGVVKPMLTLSTILVCSEKRFIKYFVDKDPEGPAKWDELKKSSHSSG